MRLALLGTLVFALMPLAQAMAAEPLTLRAFLQNTAQQHPQAKAMVERLNAARAQIKAAEGAFDARLDNTFYNRFDGFYTGQFNDTSIVKPLAPLNAEIAMGYRQSDGTFPTYQDYYFTNDQGEYNLKLAVSLLRDAFIDKDRFAVQMSKLKLEETTYRNLSDQLILQAAAAETYGQWVLAAQFLELNQTLLHLAEKRQVGLKRRVETGDAAEITLTENKQLIIQRQEKVRQAETTLKNATNNLALFYRDASGLLLASAEHLNPPAALPRLIEGKVFYSDALIADVVPRAPKLRMLEAAIAQTNQKKKLGENSLLPKLDLELYNAEDFGQGSPTRNGFESAVTVKLSVPLQRRLGAGEVAKALAEKRQLELEHQLTREQLQTALQNSANNINLAHELIELGQQEARVAEAMLQAELDAFDNGQSDILRINIREKNLFDAKLKQTKAAHALFKAEVAHLVATLQFEQLGLKKPA